ncbi:MAG: Crp/Fnr family transcriptional regulator [Spirochaetes bacterium]|nr:MAG: Crp/Fnr family transcriptional regulator [Spirochaetota bacterium]
MADDKLFQKYGHVVDAGKVIFREGEEGEEMYIIQEGSVRISKNIDGKEYTLAVLGKGDFFGEMAIVTRVKRTATATASDTVRYLSVNREGFVRMIEKNVKIALSIIDKLCRRLQKANLQISYLKKQNERGLVTLNVYYAFAEVGMENGILDLVKVSRDIAMNLELPASTITKYLKELADKEIINIEENRITLIDPGRLQSMAENVSDGIT